MSRCDVRDFTKSWLPRLNLGIAGGGRAGWGVWGGRRPRPLQRPQLSHQLMGVPRTSGSGMSAVALQYTRQYDCPYIQR